MNKIQITKKLHFDIGIYLYLDVDIYNPPYIEILKKKQRAYNCLIFQTHYNFFICVPYRSEISHKHGFFFKNTVRSTSHKSGLDYTKIVIVKNTNFLDTVDALIDKDEFKETIRNLNFIKKEALNFVEDYIAHNKKTKLLHKREYDSRYKFSSIQYFHKELGI